MISAPTPLATYRRAQFRTHRFLIRPARDNDQELMYSWRSDSATARFLSGAAPASIESQRQWFARVQNDTAYSYHIVEDNGEPIGFTSMFNADPARAEAEWGLIISKQRDPGDGRIVAPLCCKCAFELAGLEALYTCINEGNTGAVRRVEQMGAKLFEGPSAYHKKGEILLRISADNFKTQLLALIDSKPSLSKELDVEMHRAEEAE
ncbi:MAG: GNAT family N-acetyltransferase [Halioglobus sp.]